MRILRIETDSKIIELNISNMDFPNLESTKYDCDLGSKYTSMIVPHFSNADGNEFLYWDVGLTDSSVGKAALFIQSAGETLDGQCGMVEDPVFVNTQTVNSTAISTNYDGSGSLNASDVDFLCSFMHSYIQDKASLFIVDGINEYASNIYHGDIT